MVGGPAHAIVARPVGSVRSAVQKAQRLAPVGIDDRHCGQVVVGAGSVGVGLNRAMSELTGRTTKKYTAAAMRRNDRIALMKSP